MFSGNRRDKIKRHRGGEQRCSALIAFKFAQTW